MKMHIRTSTFIINLVVFLTSEFRLLDATEYDAEVEKRGAGTARMGTALAIQGTGTGSTTPANPTCKISELSLSDTDVYYYACCEGTTVTSELNVINWDCDPARKTYARINETRPFYCGGLSGEENARKRCDDRWRWLTSESCFKWTECFKGVCPFEAEKRGSAADAAFCGDGRCDGTESRQTCPTDCCPHENDRCMVANNTCPETCCNEPSCCKSTFGALSTGQVWLVIIVGVVGGILLVNLICCCCCYCCFRKCCCGGGNKSGSSGVV
ncbi:uncharacterized protein [Diadema setosum]|uniref:uncharacterized protein n=1 Tax=Diadema setosum TaxID=31175 RepID=UPI003B3BC37A